MKNSIQQKQLGELGLPIVDAIQKCVHCGFCLPACPTYQIQQHEMDSPRGRILLMKEVLEGNLDVNDAAPFINRCLGCQACETACPSGVQYGHMHSAYQAVTREETKRTLPEKTRELLIHQTVPFHKRFRWVAKIGKLLSPLLFLTPQFLKPMLGLIPDAIPSKRRLPEFSPATSERVGQVGLIAGCAQQVLAPEINFATIRVLNKIGFDVVVPRDQGCCGALDWHEGRLESARKMAAINIHAFSTDLDTIITNAAGCGSAIKEYKIVFAGTELAEPAISFAETVVDVSEFISRYSLGRARLPNPTRVGYHDACHLAHAQGIRSAPRRLLEQIENLELVPIVESDRCCGSAGTYNIKQPKLAGELGDLKAQTIIDSGCVVVAAGNIGCLVQIRQHLASYNSSIDALHTIEIVDRALQD